MIDDALTFLHLSDIHFQKRSGDLLDLDRELRDKLEKDVSVLAGRVVKKVYGILVTGDIAYSGDAKEYENALGWLTSLSRLLGLDKERVWVTPGNHDVVRERVRKSKPLKDLYLRLRNTPVKDVDHELGEVLRDSTYSEILFRPLENYLKFASKFSCYVSSSLPFWEHIINLNDGSKLCLRGLTSTLISDENDNDRENKLILGTHQAIIREDPGTTYLILCHHPFDWLHDRDKVSRVLNPHAAIQLFGHKHAQWIEHLNTNDSETIRIIAGAVQPERSDSQWIPRYNLISVGVDCQEGKRRLGVVVHSRRWNDSHRCFEPDTKKNGDPFRCFYLPLSPWFPEKFESQCRSENDEFTHEASVLSDRKPSKDQLSYLGDKPMDAARKMAYRLLTLQYHQIIGIASQLELLSDEDEGLRDFELFKRLFERAKRGNRIADLWDAVEEQHNDSTAEANPFR